jgi:nitroreductase
MDAVECMLTRRSIRKYMDIPVEWDKIGTIIESGRLAPSAGNLQNWKFIIVLEKEKRAAIAEACLQQLWMAQAPCHIIIYAVSERAKQYYGVRGERLYTIQNCAAAAENMLLTAHALGLGGCWVGAFDEDKLKTVVGGIEEVRPQIVLTIGYPDEKPAMPSKYKIENIAYQERWRQGSQMKDVDYTMGEYSVFVRQGIKQGKEFLKKVNDKIKGN